MTLAIVAIDEIFGTGRSSSSAYGMDEIIPQVGAKCLLFLNATTSYHDKVTGLLPKCDPSAGGNLLDLVKKKRSELFDSNLEYRLLEKLRVIAQHTGFSFEMVEMNAHQFLDHRGEYCYKSVLDITVTKRQLLSHKDELKKKLAGEVQSLPFERIDLKYCIRHYYQLLATCSIPDDHISPRRAAFFMARSVLRDIRSGVRTC